MEDSAVATIVLPAALSFIMLTLGTELTPADFRRVFVAPRAVGLGLLNLALMAPALAFAMAALFDLEPVFAVGLVVLGAAPGGTMANLLTHVARGDTALSVTMTAISSLAAVITVPLYLGIATSVFDADRFAEDVSLWAVVARVFAITIVPLALGMWLRARAPQRVAAARGRAKQIALTIFACVVVVVIVAEWDRVSEHFFEIVLAALGLNVGAMLISTLASRAAGLDSRQATAIGIELGVHNTTLAITVAATIASELTIPAAVYSSFMFFTAGAFARAMWRRNVALVS